MKDTPAKDEFFNQIYDTTFPRLQKFVQYRSNDSGMVDDILQEVYLEVYRHLDDLKTHENILGWLYKTAGNKTKKLNSIYTRHLVRETSLEYYGNLPEPVMEPELNTLDEYTSILKEDEIHLLLMRYQEGYSHKDLAEIFGITVGNSKMRLSRIIHKLRRYLKIFIIFLNFFVTFLFVKGIYC